MKTVPRLTPLNRTENGVALILTLSFIVLATILIVGFVVSMRTERQAAASMANHEKVKVVAEVGLEHAIALLQKNIPQPAVPGATPTASSGTNWYINPGQLTTVSSTATATIPLHSGNSTSTTDPNLNRLKLDGTHYDILGTGEPMRMAWINLLKDPSKAASATNPMMGRYAFWIDDENNKINLNTAGQKIYTSTSSGRFTNGNPTLRLAGGNYTLGHPASVELEVLSGLTAQDVTDLIATTSSRQLGSVQDVKEFVSSGSPQAFYEANKFSLTHFNSDPEFNAFGKSRIFFAGSMAYPYSYGSTSVPNLFWDTGYAYRSEATTSGTTQANVVDPTEPLIFHSDLMQSWDTYGFNGSTSSPGRPTTAAVATILNGAGNPAATTARRILTYLNTPFPGYTKSFVQKFGVREANQIAWNIYGMAAAATTPNTKTKSGAWANTTALKSSPAPAFGGKCRWAACLWDAWDPTTNAPLLNAAGETVKILPQSRSPFISKVGVGAYLTNKPVTGPNDPSGFMKNSAGIVATSSNTPSASSQIYGVRINFAFEWFLPKGYQGFQSASGWDPANDRVWVVHFEAKFNGQKIVLTSLTDSNALDTMLRGSDGPMEYKAPASPMDPNASSDGQRMATVNLGALSTGDATQSPTQSTGWPKVNTPPSNLGFGYTWDAVATPTMTISDIKIRFVASAGILDSLDPAAAGKRDLIPYQISPMRDIDRTSAIDTGFESGDATTGAISFPGTIVLQTGGAAGADTSAFGMGWRGGVGSINETNSVWCVMETADPRVNQLATDWKKSETPTKIYGTKEGNTCGIRTVGAYPVSSTDGDESKLAFPDVSLATTGRPHDTDKALSSVGWLSTVSTGMQSGKPWRTLKFQPGGGQIVAGDPPDYLLMDLFAVPFNSLTLPAGQKFPNLTGAGPRTYMNATSGKVNVNAGIFPTGASFAPPQRTLPLQALFQNTYRGSTKIDASAAQTIASAVAGGGPYTYPGQICEVAGVADTGANEWEKEALIRNLGSLLTTRSNAFSVWGVAQTIKKIPRNLSGAGARPDEFQSGDQVTGERRFRAVVERYVWRGVDGIVGNAETDSSGAYSQLGANAWLGSPTNTKDGTDPLATSFEQSYNPQAAVMKYRVRSFEFVDE